MRTNFKSITISLVVAVAAVAGFSQAVAAVGGGSARVTFVNPDQFSDFRGSGHLGTLARDSLMADLRQFVEQEAARSIPAGRTLELRILDINDAGTTSSLQREVRVSRDSSPATVDFEYTLREGDKTIASGKEYVTGLAAPVGRTSRQDETMPAVKNALGRWVQTMGSR